MANYKKCYILFKKVYIFWKGATLWQKYLVYIIRWEILENMSLAIKKIGDFSDGSFAVIVRSISGKGATVSFNDKEIPLEEGMILGKMRFYQRIPH